MEAEPLGAGIQQVDGAPIELGVEGGRVRVGKPLVRFRRGHGCNQQHRGERGNDAFSVRRILLKSVNAPAVWALALPTMLLSVLGDFCEVVRNDTYFSTVNLL
jgi:hypothetical protein